MDFEYNKAKKTFYTSDNFVCYCFCNVIYSILSNKIKIILLSAKNDNG